MNTKNKKIIAIVLAFSLIFSLIFAEAFIVSAAEHDCIGDGCNICENIAVCQKLIGVYALAVLFITALKAELFIRKIANLLFSKIIVYKNLVKLGVKLLN